MGEEVSDRHDRWSVAWTSIVGVAVCVGIVLALSALVVHEHGPTSLDEHVSRALFKHPESSLLELGERAVAFPGSKRGGLLIIVIVGGWWWLRHRDIRPGGLLAAAFALSVTTVSLLKSHLGRPNPIGMLERYATTGRSFPSMHTAVLVSLIGMILVIVALSRGAKHTVRFPVAVALSSLGIVPFAISLMSLGAHWLTDIVAGAAVAGTYVFGLLPLAYELWTNPGLSHLFGSGGDPTRDVREPAAPRP